MGGGLGRAGRGRAGGGCAARPRGLLFRAVRAVDVDVTMHAALLAARWAAAEVDPAVGAIDFEVERLAGRVQRLTVAAPTLEEMVRSGCDPLVVAHGIQHNAATVA